MIYRKLFLIIALAMVLGCATPPHKVGSDQEVNIIKSKIDKQEAVEIITNNVKVWWGYRNKYDGLRRDGFEMQSKGYLGYCGKFTVTPIGVSFEIHGETYHPNAIVQGRINADEKFEFAEVREIILIRDLILGCNRIYLKSNTDYWLMRADLKGDYKNIDGQKKVVAALEILCPNLLK